MSFSVSAYSQLQNWRAGQANLNQQLYGNPNAAPTTDYSTAFANAMNNANGLKDSLAVTALQTRLVQKASANAKPGTGKPSGGQALATAKAAGNDILTSLGLRSAPPTKKTPSSSSGPYKPPTNAATGHAYVATSAADAADLGAVNILA